MTAAAPITLSNVLGSKNIPSLPEVALRIIEIAQQPDPDPNDLVKAIRTDPATAGRVLMFANSALFGLRNQSPSIEFAVPMLGTTLIRTIVLGFYLSNHSCSDKSLQSWFRRIWRESLFQASAAEMLAERCPEADSATWFLAGLLQDVGQLAMLNFIGQPYVDEVLQSDTDLRRIDREAEAFGFTHVDVSTALCRTWNLDPEIITAVSRHHDSPSSCLNDSTPDIVSCLITSACCSDYMEGIGRKLGANRHYVEHLMLEKFRLLPNDVYPSLVEFDARAVELAIGFSIDIGDVPPREALLKRAQTVLRQVAMERKLQQIGVSPEVKDNAQPNEWVDSGTTAYNRRFLDKVLPHELEKSHAESTTIGLLEVNITDLNEGHWDEVQSQFIDIITDCVRPDDCVIRTGNSTAVVILQKLNFDSLHRIAERLKNSLTDQLDCSAEDNSMTVGGVVVVPVGRASSTVKKVVDTLAESVAAAKSSESEGIAFKILSGKKSVVASRT